MEAVRARGAPAGPHCCARQLSQAPGPVPLLARALPTRGSVRCRYKGGSAYSMPGPEDESMSPKSHALLRQQQQLRYDLPPLTMDAREPWAEGEHHLGLEAAPVAAVEAGTIRRGPATSTSSKSAVSAASGPSIPMFPAVFNLAAGRMIRAAASAAGSLAEVVQQGVAGTQSGSASTLRRASEETRNSPSALAELRAQVAALSAHNAELAARCAVLDQRAEKAESRAAMLQGRMDLGRAQRLVDGAVQVFRRHVAAAPANLDTSLFYEDESQLIATGGCGKIYAWEAAGKQWVVKADRVAYSYGYNNGSFEPERCADLLPSLLPPHPSIGAPVAWWVGAVPTAARPAKPSDIAAAAAAAVAASSLEPGCFKLYTLHERYDCSLRHHMDRLRAERAEAAAASGGGRVPAGSEPCGLELLDLRDLLVVVRDVAAALEHLAQHSVVHADVKPENVMLVFGAGGRVERAVLIDFGLSRLMGGGAERVEARGGTWLFKAPEQLAGPCALNVECEADGVARRTPYVCRSSDTFALGLLICYLAQGGELAARAGLPLGVDESKVLKWGDRPNENRNGHEPFYMLSDDVLPEPSHDDVRALLRQVARGCLAQRPDARMPPGTVRALAAEALSALRAEADVLSAFSS